MPRVKLFQALSRAVGFVCCSSRSWPCFLRFQVFPRAADVRNLSWHGVIPQGNLHQFIIPAPCLINTLPRWENWSRGMLGVDCLRVGSQLDQHQDTSLPRPCCVPVDKVLWKSQGEIPSHLYSRKFCRSWRTSNAVMKQKF